MAKVQSKTTQGGTPVQILTNNGNGNGNGKKHSKPAKAISHSQDPPKLTPIKHQVLPKFSCELEFRGKNTEIDLIGVVSPGGEPVTVSRAALDEGWEKEVPKVSFQVLATKDVSLEHILGYSVYMVGNEEFRFALNWSTEDKKLHRLWLNSGLKKIDKHGLRVTDVENASRYRFCQMNPSQTAMSVYAVEFKKTIEAGADGQGNDIQGEAWECRLICVENIKGQKAIQKRMRSLVPLAEKGKTLTEARRKAGVPAPKKHRGGYNNRKGDQSNHLVKQANASRDKAMAQSKKAEQEAKEAKEKLAKLQAALERYRTIVYGGNQSLERKAAKAAKLPDFL